MCSFVSAINSFSADIFSLALHWLIRFRYFLKKSPKKALAPKGLIKFCFDNRQCNQNRISGSITFIWKNKKHLELKIWYFGLLIRNF